MAEQPEFEFKPSPLRRILWALAMVAIIGVVATTLWRVWRVNQTEAVDEAVAQVQEDQQPTTAGAEDEDETGADEFVARADTTVTFSSLPASVDDSDAWLREQLPLVEPDPHFKPWLDSTQDILRKLVLLVNEVAQGQVPRRAFSAWIPTEPFKVKEIGEGQYVIDPASYHRYDLLAEVVEAIDVDQAWRLYQHLKPLVDEAFAEFAPPGTRFEEVLLAAVEHLLKTPQPRGEIRLIKPSVVYKYADPQLETLSAAQKQLLRMGPVNATIVKHKLGLLRGLLLQEARAVGGE